MRSATASHFPLPTRVLILPFTMSKPWHGSSNSNVGWCVAGGVAVGAAAVLAAQAIHRRFATRPEGCCPSSCGAGAGAGAGAGSDASAGGSGQGTPLVRGDVTKTDFQYPRDIRKEERWPEDSPEYKAGYARHNRYAVCVWVCVASADAHGACVCSVKPPRPEVEGDIFDRQRCIVGFDQGLIEQQTCFVLGTGGIGQNVALTLARLGVKKIIMLDCDTYACVYLPPAPCLDSRAIVCVCVCWGVYVSWGLMQVRCLQPHTPVPRVQGRHRPAKGRRRRGQHQAAQPAFRD